MRVCVYLYACVRACVYACMRVLYHNQFNLHCCVKGYARLLMKKKQYKEAIRMFTESLDIAKEVYGMDHPQVSSVEKLGTFYFNGIM